MDYGTLPEWLSLVVNGAVAGAALLGLVHARRDTRRAEERAEAAQRELAEDRARHEAARLARLDFESLNDILRLHGARTTEHIVLMPVEIGRIRASLAVLPPGSVPKTRAMYQNGFPGPTPTREAVTAELHAAVRELRTRSIAAA